MVDYTDIRDNGLPTIKLNPSQYKEYVNNAFKDLNNLSSEKQHDMIMGLFIGKRKAMELAQEVINMFYEHLKEDEEEILKER